MSSERRGVLQFLGVACLIVGGPFVVLSLPFFWGQIQVLRSWPVRQAQVLRSQVVTQPAAKHDQLYAATIQIVYVVNGQPVTAELTSFQSSNYEETVRRAAEFPVGSRQAIRYDPHNPVQARIGAGWNRRFFAVPLITLGCGLVFGAVAGGFLIGVRMARRGQGLGAGD
ncbi:MAG: DUF3592 domain-containing protein [Candidatus Korobacteraceae bacterium]